jgi:hypothetical protein
MRKNATFALYRDPLRFTTFPAPEIIQKLQEFAGVAGVTALQELQNILLSGSPRLSPVLQFSVSRLCTKG